MIYVLWHQVPDTDAITSALIYAHYLNLIGIEAQAIALGHINNETRLVLNRLGIAHPDIMTSLPDESVIALVDHNESAQSIDKRSQYTIHSVVDHHKLGDLETSSPILLRFEPLASTNSILYKMYVERLLTISPEIATLMLAGILSDTLHFRSPTTTDEDKAIALRLQAMTTIVDLEEYAMDMFAAKSDLGDISAYGLIKTTDFKDFLFSNPNWSHKCGVTCIETTNPEYCLNRKDEILSELTSIKTKEWYDSLLFCIIDILHETNITLIASDTEATIVHNVFGVSTHDWLAQLGNRISRKKQIVPALQAYLEK